jgi:hypothetical protein
LATEEKRRTEMSNIQSEIAAPEGIVLSVLMHLKNGDIEAATASFAKELEFKRNSRGLRPIGTVRDHLTGDVL